ncbi:MAG TPA: helix-turn-helix domain-containing protein [Waddliaceae bacterium]
MTKEVLNAQEACDFLQVGKATLYRHTKIGEIPSFRIGKALRFHKESLERWIEKKVAEDLRSKQGQR